jgi:hypothetical protein
MRCTGARGVSGPADFAATGTGFRTRTGAGAPGLDLICTKVAVDFQAITSQTADQRIKEGLEQLTSLRRPFDVLDLQSRSAERARAW